jgi:Domain of unknown function (DUF4326)
LFHRCLSDPSLVNVSISALFPKERTGWFSPSRPRKIARMPPQRIQLKRTKGWRMPANTLKVDRSTIYGNPFGGEVRTPKEAVAMFEDWLADPAWDQHAGAGYPALIVKQLMDRRREVLASLPSLRGFNLACWCRLPGDGEIDGCHAAVLLKLVNA